MGELFIDFLLAIFWVLLVIYNIVYLDKLGGFSERYNSSRQTDSETSFPLEVYGHIGLVGIGSWFIFIP